MAVEDPMLRLRFDPRLRAHFSAGVPLALSLFTALTVQSANAQSVTLPPELAPGAGCRLVFATSGIRDATSAKAADDNSFVTSAANAVPALAALATTWTAVAETPAVTAPDNIGTNPLIVNGTPTNPGVPFVRLDGARVADDNPYFWNMTFPLAAISS
jgi:hypothetical protein